MGGYSLEALTGNEKVMSAAQLSDEEDLVGKISMKTIFGRRKVKKDGSEGKIITISPVEELQREERKPWVCYSVLDAKSTLKLYESLKNQLSHIEWKLDGKPVSGKSMFDFYQLYWQPFGELLVKMESEGMLVDRAYLAEIEKVAKAEQEVAVNRFRNWASRYCPDAKYMNVGSDTQLRQLFFGGIANRYSFLLSYIGVFMSYMNLFVDCTEVQLPRMNADSFSFEILSLLRTVGSSLLLNSIKKLTAQIPL